MADYDGRATEKADMQGLRGGDLMVCGPHGLQGAFRHVRSVCGAQATEGTIAKLWLMLAPADAEICTV
jgi:hypothetical protein